MPAPTESATILNISGLRSNKLKEGRPLDSEAGAKSSMLTHGRRSQSASMARESSSPHPPTVLKSQQRQSVFNYLSVPPNETIQTFPTFSFTPNAANDQATLFPRAAKDVNRVSKTAPTAVSAPKSRTANPPLHPASATVMPLPFSHSIVHQQFLAAGDLIASNTNETPNLTDQAITINHNMKSRDQTWDPTLLSQLRTVPEVKNDYMGQDHDTAHVQDQEGSNAGHFAGDAGFKSDDKLIQGHRSSVALDDSHDTEPPRGAKRLRDADDEFEQHNGDPPDYNSNSKRFRANSHNNPNFGRLDNHWDGIENHQLARPPSQPSVFQGFEEYFSNQTDRMNQLKDKCTSSTMEEWLENGNVILGRFGELAQFVSTHMKMKMDKIVQAYATTAIHHVELDARDGKLKQARLGLVKQTGTLVGESVGH